jgi:hypothetical protein
MGCATASWRSGSPPPTRVRFPERFDEIAKPRAVCAPLRTGKHRAESELGPAYLLKCSIALVVPDRVSVNCTQADMQELGSVVLRLRHDHGHAAFGAGLGWLLRPESMRDELFIAAGCLIPKPIDEGCLAQDARSVNDLPIRR